MVATDDAPYIHVVADHSAVRATGMLRSSFGHRLAATTHGPDGVFAQWSFEDGRLLVETDRYGMYPLFVHIGKQEIFISPSVVKLLELGVPRDLDLDALCVFLHIGFFLRDETPFRAIRALPPAARVEWTRSSVSISGEPIFVRPQEIDRDDAVDAYIELFRQAIRRRQSHGRTVVPLSGGRDSRHILFELVDAGRKPDVCVTAHYFPPRPDEDAIVAPRVAAAVGVRHVLLEQGDELDAEVSKNLATGFCTDEHAWFAVVAEFLSHGSDTVYDGIGGDVLSAGLFLTPDRLEKQSRGSYGELAETFFKPRYARTLSKLLAREIRPALSPERAKERLAAELATHAGAANPIGSFCFWNRTRREIALAPYAMGPASATVYAPYLDHELYDFLASLPVEMLVDRSFHTDTVRRAFPEHADIGFERKRLDHPDARRHDRRIASALIRSSRTGRDGTRTLLARRFASQLRLATAIDRLRKEPARLQPRLALYLCQLEAAAGNRLVASL